MSIIAEDVEHEQEVESHQEETIKWLKVIAQLLAQMAGTDHNDIYEDLE